MIMGTWRTATFALVFVVYIARLCDSSTAPVNCDEDQPQVRECLEPLEGFEYETDNAIVPTMEPSALQEHCRRYDQFEECMKSVTPNCKSWDKLHYQGIEALYQYLCYDEHDGYLKYRDCFMNDNLYKEGDRCNHTYFASQIDLVDSNPIDHDYARDRLCQYTNQYLDCVENVVESFCEKDAALWNRNLDIAYYNPTLTAIGCPIETHSGLTSWLAIVIGVLVPFSLIVVIVSVAVLVWQYRKKRRPMCTTDQQRNSHGPMVEPPPAYQGIHMVYNPTAQNVNQFATGPLTDKSGLPPEPPAYENPSAPDTTEEVDVTDGVAAVGYFGVNSAMDPRPSAKQSDGDNMPPYESLP